jgi:hypothetical protein
VFLVELLLMGSKTRERIRLQDFATATTKETKELLSKIIPQFAGLLVQDMIVAADPSLEKATRKNPPESLMASIGQYPFIGGALMLYILQRFVRCSFGGSLIESIVQSTMPSNHAPAGLTPTRTSNSSGVPSTRSPSYTPFMDLFRGVTPLKAVSTNGVDEPDLLGVVKTLPMLVDTINGAWHFTPEDGSGEIREQFARSVLMQCREKAVPTLIRFEPACIRLLTMFFAPRVALGVEWHLQLLVLLKDIVRAHPDAAKYGAL